MSSLFLSYKLSFSDILKYLNRNISEINFQTYTGLLDIIDHKTHINDKLFEISIFLNHIIIYIIPKRTD